MLLKFIISSVSNNKKTDWENLVKKNDEIQECYCKTFSFLIVLRHAFKVALTVTSNITDCENVDHYQMTVSESGDYNDDLPDWLLYEVILMRADML